MMVKDTNFILEKTVTVIFIKLQFNNHFASNFRNLGKKALFVKQTVQCSKQSIAQSYL